MKRYISFLLACILLLTTLALPASALTEESHEISFEVFYEALQKEYKKYNVDFTIDKPNLDIVYTTELLELECKMARLFCQGLSVDVEENPTKLPTEIRPNAMPAYYGWEKTARISSNNLPAVGYVSIRFGVNGKVDLQNGAISTLNQFLEESTSMNLAENNLTLSATRTQNNMKIYVVLSGSVKFSWTDPYTNTVFGNKVNGPFFIDTIDPNNNLW